MNGEAQMTRKRLTARKSGLAALVRLGVVVLALLGSLGLLSAATLSDPAVDRYNIRVGTQTFSGLYHFTSSKLLVETANAIHDLGSDTIKCYLGPNTAGQSGVTLAPNITSLTLIVRDDPSYHAVLDMPFRHFIMWAYPLSTGGTAFQSGNYTSSQQAADYNEMYNLTSYLLTNYNNSGKTFYLGHWEGDGYLKVNGWTTNQNPAVVSAMIVWENNRQKAVDDAKAAAHYTNVNVFYYAEANRVRDAMLNGPANNVRMINAVIPYVTNLDYVSYSSYDAQNLSTSDLYTTLNYMEAHFPTNKAGKVPGERMWIGEYGWGNLATAAQEPNNRAYIQRLLGWQGAAGALQFILFWEIYNNEASGGTNFCLIDSSNNKVASWYLHERFINQARLLTAQFNETKGRLPTDAEFSSLVSPMLNAVLPAPVPLAVSNLGASRLSSSDATVSGKLAQGVYGDDRALVRVFWGRQDGGTVRGAWEQNLMVGVNTNFNASTLAAQLANLIPNTNYFFRFYATNASGEAWAPASAQFSTVTLNPPDFGARLKIAFTGYNRGEALANFPVLVNLGTNLPGFSYRQFASATAGDLRFTDASGLVIIPHEIDEWNTNGTSAVWVQVPLLSATNDFIWAYWGNPAATNPPASTTNGAVWSPNHNLVWHLKEAALPFADSTLQYPATNGVAPVSTNGIVGHGGFLGGGSFLDAGVINLSDAFTLNAWLNLAPGVSDIQTVWANKVGGSGVNGIALFVNTYRTSDQKIHLETGNGTASREATSAAGAVSPGQWHLLAAVVDRAAGSARLFVDGVDATASGAIRTDFANTNDVLLGRFADANFGFHGQLDEVRIQAGTNSANWVWASWMTVASNTNLQSYSVVTQQQPLLSLTTGGSGSLLTWPGNGVGFSLYFATNLTPPVAWNLATNKPALVNTQWQISLPTNGSNLFYRLQSP
jgi:hypothetical protein